MSQKNQELINRIKNSNQAMTLKTNKLTEKEISELLESFKTQDIKAEPILIAGVKGLYVQSGPGLTLSGLPLTLPAVPLPTKTRKIHSLKGEELKTWQNILNPRHKTIKQWLALAREFRDKFGLTDQEALKIINSRSWRKAHKP